MILQNGFLKIAAASGGSIKNDFYNFFLLWLTEYAYLHLYHISNAYHVSPFSPKNNEMYFFSRIAQPCVIAPSLPAHISCFYFQHRCQQENVKK